jgi:glycine cleavage system H protein
MKVGEHEIPDGLYYTKDHEWVKLEGNLARVGVTDYAQKQLGDVVYVELPEVGKVVKRAEESKTKETELGAVESIKAVSAVYPPLSGTVKETNQVLQDRPELINTSPYDEGWVCVLEPSDLEAERESLMSSDAYAVFLKTLK